MYVLILHCTAGRVIYSTNIGEIAANTQIPTQPKTFDGMSQPEKSPSKKGFAKLQENDVDIGQICLN